jgi:hypothetical protein
MLASMVIVAPEKVNEVGSFSAVHRVHALTSCLSMFVNMDFITLTPNGIRVNDE